MSIPCTTSFSFEGHRITEYKGLVRGIVVRAPTISQGILGGLKRVVGGRIESYRAMCEQVRGEALEHLLEHAEQIGAHAVIGLRYESSEVAQGATEVLCYGTAVMIAPE
ncbi:MAG: YbjQ family protein [Phycisphaerales bacterium]|nr:YbjQ family protein [Phycisphaerales bacterium]